MPEIIGITEQKNVIETVNGNVDFQFVTASVNPLREFSVGLVLNRGTGNPVLGLHLAVPNDARKIKEEFKNANETSRTMQSGLARIEKMRHSLFDFDYLQQRHYEGIRWNLIRLALSHSIAVNGRVEDNSPNRFRFDRPIVIERFLPVASRLLEEEELFGRPQNILHESIELAMQRQPLAS